MTVAGSSPASLTDGHLCEVEVHAGARPVELVPIGHDRRHIAPDGWSAYGLRRHPARPDLDDDFARARAVDARPRRKGGDRSPTDSAL